MCFAMPSLIPHSANPKLHEGAVTAIRADGLTDRRRPPPNDRSADGRIGFGREKPRGSFRRSFYPLGAIDPARTPTPKGWSPRGSRSDLSVSSGPVRGCPRTDKWEGRRAFPNMQARTCSIFRDPGFQFRDLAPFPCSSGFTAHRGREIEPSREACLTEPASVVTHRWASKPSRGGGTIARSNASTSRRPYRILRPDRVPMKRRSCSSVVRPRCAGSFCMIRNDPISP